MSWKEPWVFTKEQKMIGVGHKTTWNSLIFGIKLITNVFLTSFKWISVFTLQVDDGRKQAIDEIIGVFEVKQVDILKTVKLHSPDYLPHL